MEKIVVGNLKMNLEENDVENYVKVIRKYKNEKIDLYIAPSYLYLNEFKVDNYHLTAQNLSEYDDGNFTGEISAKQLSSIGVDSVILGHIERRKLYNEDNEIINKKVLIALQNNLKVILCIENMDDISKCLKDVETFDDIVIAYEPSKYIGSSECENIDDIKNMITKIKSNFNNIKVIYGGSVNSKNISDIVDICDGVIVGKNSINVDNFINLLNMVE